MRYAALVAASAAVLAVFTLPRDGRGDAPAVARQAAARLAGAAWATQPVQAVVRGQGAQQEDFRWSGRIARGNEIEIRGLLGDVRAVASSGDEVEVVGRRIGEDARHVRIEVVESRDGIVICAVYPRTPNRWNDGDDDDDGRRSRRQSDDDDDGDDACDHGRESVEMELDSDEARIDFTVRVPAGVKFVAHVVDGNIDADGLRSDVEVATVTGDVRVATTGTANAASVSGNVDATFGQAGEDMTFASVSGDVTVSLAADVGAEVEANTLSGQIQSDFDLRMRSMTDDDDEEDEDDDGGFNIDIDIGRHASGTIGGGGPELSVNTVSGNIRLRRAR